MLMPAVQMGGGGQLLRSGSPPAQVTPGGQSCGHAEVCHQL